MLNRISSIIRSVRSLFAPSTAPIVQNLEAPKSLPLYAFRSGDKASYQRKGRFLSLKVIGRVSQVDSYLVKRPKYDTVFAVPASQLRPRSGDIVAAQL